MGEGERVSRQQWPFCPGLMESTGKTWYKETCPGKNQRDVCMQERSSKSSLNSSGLSNQEAAAGVD